MLLDFRKLFQITHSMPLKPYNWEHMVVKPQHILIHTFSSKKQIKAINTTNLQVQQK